MFFLALAYVPDINNKNNCTTGTLFRIKHKASGSSHPTFNCHCQKKRPGFAPVALEESTSVNVFVYKHNGS
jgi:hypothetical protein